MNQAYIGTELELFANAQGWKSYLADRLRPHIAGQVLDVGAGIGGNLPYLFHDAVDNWLCLEPDATMAEEIARKAAQGLLPPRCDAMCGTMADLAPSRLFDTILYLDVIEHIAKDRDEMACAARHLPPGGRLIVLVPAHQCLFSPFDAAIGHHRRYDRRGLEALAPPGCRLSFSGYLDSVGFLASLANRLLLRQTMPTAGQVALWDKWMVPLSRHLDARLGYRFGKSAVAIWTRAA